MNMYTVLIVEDEKIEREHLVHMIKKDMDEISTIWSAKNGFEALALYEQHKIDLIITDIEMPGMSGLELIVKIKQIDPLAIFIILTSYNYFEYAQKAIRLGVEDFILKPASSESIRAIIQKVFVSIQQNKTRLYQTSELVSKMNKMKPILETDCLQAILTNSDCKDIEMSLSLLDYHPLEAICIIFKHIDHKKDSVLSFIGSVEDVGYKCIHDNYYNSFVIYILYASSFAIADIKTIESILMTHFSYEDELYIGNVQRKTENFYKSYQYALHNKVYDHALRITRDTSVLFTSTTFETLGQDILKAYRNVNRQEVNHVLDMLYYDLLSYDLHQIHEYIALFYRDFLRILTQEYPDLTHELTQIEERLVPETITLQNMQSHIKTDIWSFFKPIDDFHEQSTNILVKKSLDYIAKNYHNPINLNDLAAYLKVTPFYVSKLLNQHSDLNFTDLVSRYRIEESKLLLQKNMRIKEIAYHLGFQSQSYFAKVFKKFTGMTPKEYKNSIS